MLEAINYEQGPQMATPPCLILKFVFDLPGTQLFAIFSGSKNVPKTMHL